MQERSQLESIARRPGRRLSARSRALDDRPSHRHRRHVVGDGHCASTLGSMVNGDRPTRRAISQIPTSCAHREPIRCRSNWIDTETPGTVSTSRRGRRPPRSGRQRYRSCADTQQATRLGGPDAGQYQPPVLVGPPAAASFPVVPSPGPAAGVWRRVVQRTCQ